MPVPSIGPAGLAAADGRARTAAAGRPRQCPGRCRAPAAATAPDGSRSSSTMSTRPPGRLYLMALLSRLSSTWRSRVRSACGHQARRWRGSLGQALQGPLKLQLEPHLGRVGIGHAPSSGPLPAKAAQRAPPRRPASWCRFRCASGPATRRSSATGDRPPRGCGLQPPPLALRWCGSTLVDLHQLRAKPSTAFSGVRSSWLMRDRNSDLARLAAAATAAAWRASSSSRRSVTSCR